MPFMYHILVVALDLISNMHMQERCIVALAAAAWPTIGFQPKVLHDSASE